jgi:PhoPQ-activated pathogenicity-related protein
MPMRGELPEVAVRHCVQPTAAGRGWSLLAAAISDPDGQAVVMFAAIGFLATINAVLYFPDFGEALARLAIFP